MLRENQPNRRKTDATDSESHAHRRKVDTDAVLHLHSRVADCEESIGKLLDANNLMTGNLKQLNDSLTRVAEVLEAWNNAKGFIATLKFMSTAIKIVAPIMLAGGAVWLFVRTGQWISKS